MATQIVWRTDSRRFEPGEEVTSAGDHALTLDAAHVATEQALRDGIPNGRDLRTNSLYTWRDESWARSSWQYEDKFLYKLEVDTDDIRHTGDVCYYTDTGTAIKKGDSPAESVEAYASGKSYDPKLHFKPRVEVLVTKAKVLERYELQKKDPLEEFWAGVRKG
ncbi:hypothetical protein ACVDG5_022075 [Mesorhizobium sp. ORM6]